MPRKNNEPTTMSGVHETAYPRLKLEFTEQELASIYTPTPQELAFVREQYRQATHRTYLLIQLKLLQRLGYFLPLSTVPPVVVEHICKNAALRVPVKSDLVRYDQSGSKSVHHQRLRAFVGIRVLDTDGEQWLEQRAFQAAQTKQELPDIINVLIEELVQQRYELPGFTFLFRLARQCRATVNDRIYKSVAGKLSNAVTARLDRLLEPSPGRSVWDSLKREPKQPNVREVTDFLQHIDAMIALSEDLPDTAGIAATKRSQLVLV